MECESSEVGKEKRKRSEMENHPPSNYRHPSEPVRDVSRDDDPSTPLRQHLRPMYIL